MKTINRITACLLFVTGLFLSSCTADDPKDDAFYTFTGETVASFCRNTDELSLFSQMIDDAGYRSLLALYGHYTCFAPTDAAIENYLREEGISFSDLTEEDKATILNDHIIKNDAIEYLSESFQEGALPTPNMNERYLVISYTQSEEGTQIILVNKDAPVVSKDNEVHNGVVHVVGKVVRPSQNDLLSVMREAGYFRLFSEAFALTNLSDSISEIYDYNYSDPYPGVDKVDVVGYSVSVLHTKRHGYTILAESDEVFRNAGINNLDDLIELAKKHYGTEDIGDFTSRNNPLNRFISYHMLDRQMPTNSFVYSGANTAAHAMDQRHEYYETMLHLRLIEFKAGNKINTQNNGAYVGVDESLSNLDGMNGYVHALTGILLYDEDVMTNDVLHKRLRIDAYAIPPQLTNNNVRWKLLDGPRTITPDFCGDHFQINPACKIILWASESWDDHQADEISIRGWYDFTLRLPPVPPGTYEIRFGYNAVDWRGIAQLFIDGEIVGIPVDLSINGADPRVGWVADSETTDNGVENDKMMRNRGYMKSGAAIINSGYGHALRNARNDLRVIVGTFTFQEYDYHYFRAKNVEREDGEFHLDFIEYVPVSYLERETRD